jgi:ELWxxDGT repeat protein
LVKDVWPGVPGGTVGNFSKVINKLIFTGNDGVNGYKTWQSDGSAAGTTIATGVGNPGNGDLQELVETDNSIFASIRQSDIGRELWAINYTSILPLELLEFKGKLENNDALLNWETSNEINTKEFVVERSVNGSNYIPAGTVISAKSPGIHNYSFTDHNIAASGADIVYYRLKQIDVDNRYTYSKVISISIMNITDAGLYPNPATNEINLLLSSLRNEKMDYQVFDNAGRIVMQETKQVLPGTNRMSVDINKLSAGVYYIKLTGNSITQKLQFVKQ